MKTPINPYFADDEIRELAAKVVSVRSLEYDIFAKHLVRLMEACHEKAYSEGYGEGQYDAWRDY